MPTNTKKQSTLVQAGFDSRRGSATGSAASQPTGNPNAAQTAATTVSPGSTPKHINPRTRSSQRHNQGQAARAPPGSPSHDKADKTSSPSWTGSKRRNKKKGSKGKSKAALKGLSRHNLLGRNPRMRKGCILLTFLLIWLQ